MEDGRIAVQGSVAELQAQGVLDAIAHEAVVERKRKKSLVAAEALLGRQPVQEEVKAPRKLATEEHRGGLTFFW
jgi:hypothetical protein